MNINLTLIGQTITFAIFVWFWMKFIWPPIMTALDERKKRIADGLAAAERGKHEQELGEKRAKQVIVEAKEQVTEMVHQAQRRADEIVEEAKDSARGEGEKLIQAARAEIDQELNRARDQLRRELAGIAIAGAEQILMREVDSKAHNEMLDKIAAEL
ncbi:MAG: F0F1 ATP synthase subunit B [Gammaproteobacteria bacterium]|nr:MAG: F0F1 ATP synthase subunit B [Gammaproteobacteria bacterium]